MPGKIAAAAFGTVLLSGCQMLSNEPPACSDEATLGLVRQIIAEKVGGMTSLPSADMLSQRLRIGLPHATRLEENIRKYTCEATLAVGDAPGELDIGYSSQLDDAGDHLVEVSGINLLDASLIKAGLAAPELRSEPTAEPVITPDAVAKDQVSAEDTAAAVSATANASRASAILDAALSLDRDAMDFSSKVDEQMNRLVAAGALPSKPAFQMDYSRYYVPSQPLTVAGAQVAVLEYQVMEEFIGCCVNPGLSVVLRDTGGLRPAIEEFARANNCAVNDGEHIYLPDEVAGALKGAGENVELSCGESDSHE
jgi:hypothetical protein